MYVVRDIMYMEDTYTTYIYIYSYKSRNPRRQIEYLPESFQFPREILSIECTSTENMDLHGIHNELILKDSFLWRQRKFFQAVRPLMQVPTR